MTIVAGPQRPRYWRSQMLASAICDDLAEAPAVALTSDNPGDVSYELGGTAFTMAEVAAAISGKGHTFESCRVRQIAHHPE